MIINDDLSLNTRLFKIKSTEYEIYNTEVGGKGVYNAIDYVRNLETMEVKKFRRADLKIMLHKFNAKVLQLKTKLVY